MRSHGCKLDLKVGDDHVLASHFFIKLAFAAPASFLPSFPTAPASQHFFIELALAAPARALPSLLTALAAQAAPSCARAGEAANSESKLTTTRRFIAIPPWTSSGGR